MVAWQVRILIMIFFDLWSMIIVVQDRVYSKVKQIQWVTSYYWFIFSCNKTIAFIGFTSNLIYLIHLLWFHLKDHITVNVNC